MGNIVICDTSGYYPNVSYINLMMKQIPNFSAGKKKKKAAAHHELRKEKFNVRHV